MENPLVDPLLYPGRTAASREQQYQEMRNYIRERETNTPTSVRTVWSKDYLLVRLVGQQDLLFVRVARILRGFDTSPHVRISLAPLPKSLTLTPTPTQTLTVKSPPPTHTTYHTTPLTHPHTHPPNTPFCDTGGAFGDRVPG